MEGYGIFMIVFSILIILAGFYIYLGHNSELLLWKGYNPNASKSNLKMVGRATMSFGLIPLTSGIVALLCEEESIVPFYVLLVLFIAWFIGTIWAGSKGK